MNARQHAFAADAEAFTSGNRAPWEYTESPLSWEMACDEFRADSERFGSWMQSVNGDREHAVMFPEGPISVPELLAIVLDKAVPPWQCQEAAKEIDRRYIAHCKTELAERAYQLATRS
jgi:hypothetical protein